MSTLLVWLAVAIALWQLYRRSIREREAAVQRERLRIARDMHDSIGRRLGLAAVQAGALEVSAGDDETSMAARRVGDTVRDAVEELHDLVGVLRDGGTGTDRSLTPGAVSALIDQSRRSGTAIELHQSGAPSTLPPGVGRAAYGVIEEGLANAAKHAPGRPVSASITWEDDALLLALSNPLDADAAPVVASGGHGLAGLRERVESAGGLLDVRSGDGRFQLSAMLPAAEPAASGRGRWAMAGTVAVLVLLALIPMSATVGVSQ